MTHEKGMIEINLNKPSKVGTRGKGFNYFGNISWVNKSHKSGFTYDQYHNEAESVADNKSANFCGLKFISTGKEVPQRISCLRQMYCPDCQARLNEDSILVGRQGFCCFPLFSINRLCKTYLKRQSDRRVHCKHCGADLGYFKQI